jgi:glutamine amidotransferase
MITIVDYGSGNLRSVQKAFERLGAEAVITDDPNVVAEADRLVLPGVGAFGDAMRELRSRGLVEPIVAHLRADRPFFGICMGLQLLFETGWEGGWAGLPATWPGSICRRA